MADETSITVLRGHPDEAELAAVTVVLLALLRGSGEPEQEVLAAYAGWTVKGGGYRPSAAWSGQ
ncbi:acyl-CoA carboxylase subunit epsilon [Streptomyces sp. E11-3]|uniref:acyl-CoA carboxylase subunit epsilon n=1 Tax=Streptomyces sp. E11-3 TaxID=3110112 RepID=UPI00397FEF47